jgi:hypothetical protein
VCVRMFYTHTHTRLFYADLFSLCLHEGVQNVSMHVRIWDLYAIFDGVQCPSSIICNTDTWQRIWILILNCDFNTSLYWKRESACACVRTHGCVCGVYNMKFIYIYIYIKLGPCIFIGWVKYQQMHSVVIYYYINTLLHVAVP